MTAQFNVHDAAAFNRTQIYPPWQWSRIQTVVSAGADGIPGLLTARAVRDWQRQHALTADGMVGPLTLARLKHAMVSLWQWRQLNADERSILVSYTVAHEGGGRDPWGAINADGEYEGRFDTPKRDAQGRKLKPSARVGQPGWKPHSASKFGPNPWHVGISFGAWQFTQDGGSLGRVLTRFHELDPGAFRSVFGSHWRALLDTVTRRGRTRVRGRSPRVQPVGGADLWKAPWHARFRAAGKIEACRQAQREVVAGSYLDPMIAVARSYGLDTQSAVAVLFDIAIQFGRGGESGFRGARGYIRRALGEPAPVEDQDVALDRIIDALPDPREARRRSIAARAEPFVRYRACA